MSKLSIDDLDVAGKRVLVRVDFNVPLKEGKNGALVVGDDTRIRAALPTIRALQDRGGKVILMSHLGRPSGEPKPEFSLAPVAERLQELLSSRVRFISNTIGPAVAETVRELPEGGILLLENTRFNAGETKNDEAFSSQLAGLGDFFVNDAFGSSHRAHASTEGVTHKVQKSAQGYLLEKEVEYLSKLIEQPEHPYVAVLGGAKVSDKIGLIENLLDRVDSLLIGGAMSYTFLKALGRDVGASKVEDDKLDVAADLYERAGSTIKLPHDHVVAKAFENDAERKIVSGAIPDGWMALDIGPETVAAYREAVIGAKTVVWNGPMGVFEMDNFSKGTFAVAEALARATNKGALTVVGGGDSVAAVVESGYSEQISHVSTGGGAMLEFLEGRSLPGIVALTDK